MWSWADLAFTATFGGGGVTVTPASGLTTTEAGGGATFNVVLDAPPTSSVFIALSSSDTSEGVVTLPSSGALEFTPANWDVPQAVFIQGVDDSLDDGDMGYTIITEPAVSLDPLYDKLVVADVSVTNSDDDTAGISVSPISGDTSEGGGTATFTVRLNSEPTGNVSIPLSSSDTSEGTVSPAGLTFTAASWNTPQTVTVTGVDDAVQDGNILYSVVIAPASSSDGMYNLDDKPDVGLSNIDNDSAGIVVGPVSDNTTEAGGTATFTVRLSSEPTDDVVIGLSSSNSLEGTVSPTSLTFTAANWDAPRTVTLTGVDDFVDDDDQPYQILMVSTSTDPLYHGIAPAPVSLDNLDNDGAGITVSAISGNTSEAGGTATFTVRLASQPTGDVTIPLTSSNPAEGGVSPASLTFTAASWNTPQTVTVTGIDDFVDDGHVGYTIDLAPASSSDTNYDGQDAGDVPVTNIDNDTAGITVAPTSGLVTSEAGGTASFTVRLDSEPLADVSIFLISSDGSEGSVSPASLIFTSANWSAAQSVTVTGVDDVVDEGAGSAGNIGYKIVTTASSTDPLYNAIEPADVDVTNTDNDTAAILVSLTGNLDTSETGGTASFTVALASQPAGSVSIGLTSSDTSEGTVSPASLTFTPANWNTPQIVTVTGVNDFVADGPIAYQIVTAPATSSDPLYNGQNPADANVTNSDNDSAGIVVSAVSGNTSEAGGTASFTVRLTSEPTANVTIGLSSSDTSEGTVSPASLTFTAANWSSWQTVTITGVDDAVQDGDIGYTIVTAPASSADSGYSGRDAANLSLFNADNDGAGITVSPLDRAPTEAGGTGSFTVRLNSEPTDNVVIGMSSSDITEGTVICDAVPSLTFTPANWDTAQACTVTGVDDAVQDGDIGYTIILAPATSNDPNYTGRDPADVSATTLDNDVAGITVAPTSGRVTSEAGGTATFTVRLTSKPTDDVVIGLSSSDLTEGTVSPASLTFTADNWNIAQTVTLTGVNDDLDDGDITYQIVTAPASSGDLNYNQLNAADVVASNTDNDTAGITVAPTGGLFTSEAGGTASFTVVLNSRPNGDVSIGLSSSDTTEGTLSAVSLSFTPASWNVAQTVTVTGVNDNVDDGNIVYSLLSSAAVSGDPAYNGLNPADVSATNLDNDTVGVTVTPSGGLITSEAGASATFTVRLNSEPTDDVTVNLVSSDTSEGTVSPASLTFTALNWNVARTVTISGIDDALVDGDQPYLILLTMSSGDTKFDELSSILVGVTSLDNEPGSAGQIQFSSTSYNAPEQGGARLVTVRRVGGSSGAVTVQYRTENGTATAPGDYTAQSGTLSWASGDMADKTFSVPIIADAADENNETVAIILSSPTGGAVLGSPAVASIVIIDSVAPAPNEQVHLPMVIR